MLWGAWHLGRRPSSERSLRCQDIFGIPVEVPDGVARVSIDVIDLDRAKAPGHRVPIEPRLEVTGHFLADLAYSGSGSCGY